MEPLRITNGSPSLRKIFDHEVVIADGIVIKNRDGELIGKKDVLLWPHDEVAVTTSF